jgi:hypothetical protein
MIDAWDQRALEQELQRYEQELKASGFAPTTLATYVENSRRFLRWWAGGYVPRGASPHKSVGKGGSGPEELAAELITYRAQLHTAGLAPLTVHTYLDHPARFLRWLVGDYQPGPVSGEVADIDAPARHPDVRAPIPSGDWLGEAEVQAAIVAFLVSEGWTIDRQADTAKRERGIDVVASRGPERLAIEVKGFPGRVYVRGPRAGQPKPTHPSLQASHYFAGALLSAIAIRESLPDVGVVIGLPDVQRYRDLVSRSASSLGMLEITLLLVKENGSVVRHDAKEFQIAR